ncbi:glycerate kinase [Aestuariimicrobium sp. T2.26MG-19.2B]|uniref:glycerate kinase n=1 Tax=Aestuariimicrobium sp. T2.26MG-19.2B TaxID=3040679 RepID=UPI0024776193|nr:glycerate kinase [Aestuariimicrobium sp. T2.26MG-19.2B]CAI9403864.1 Glycerate 3-kinase [Aestuariimicrobium sp. T2.26MG-19.2B]
MRVVVAMDKFKGSLTAVEANARVARGARSVLPGADVVTLPVADGGDGTLDAARAAGFEWHPVTCTGPTGEPVESGFALRDGVAVAELADACGLLRLPPGPDGRTVLAAGRSSTRGLGEVMAAALDAHCSQLVVGLGGSASTDGGAGLLQALGVDLLDEDGRQVPPGLDGLARLASVDTTGLHPRLGQVEVVVASDVDNPLLGPSGAAHVFGPQKGLTTEDVDRADQELARLADLLEGAQGRGARERAGAGAAGGAGWALLVLGGRMRRGVDVVLDWSGADAAVEGADLVLTGEGSLDDQSLAGKAPVGVADLAARHRVPVGVLSGRRSLSDSQLRAAGFARAVALTDLEPSLERCLTEAGPLLELAAATIVRDLGLAPG